MTFFFNLAHNQVLATLYIFNMKFGMYNKLIYIVLILTCVSPYRLMRTMSYMQRILYIANVWQQFVGINVVI